jgi:hypothetical protein
MNMNSSKYANGNKFLFRIVRIMVMVILGRFKKQTCS